MHNRNAIKLIQTVGHTGIARICLAQRCYRTRTKLAEVGEDVTLHLFSHRLHCKKKNKRVVVVDALGKERIAKIYDLADIYHSDNIERVSDDFIEEAGITTGNFDNVAECQYAIPSHWDIGKVYKRLIKQVALEKNIEVVDALIEVYHSFISDKIDDYNSSVYYENPSYIFESFIQNKML